MQQRLLVKAEPLQQALGIRPGLQSALCVEAEAADSSLIGRAKEAEDSDKGALDGRPAASVLACA